MSLNSEENKNLSEVIKNYVLAFSILVGGGWTVYLFNVNLVKENSILEIKKKQQSLVQRPLVHADISSEVTYYEYGQYWIVEVAVSLENKGQIDAVIDLDHQSIRLAEIAYEGSMVKEFNQVEHGTFVIIRDKSNGNFFINNLSLLAGQKKTQKFSIRLMRRGVFQIDFVATPGKSILEAREKEKIKEENVEASVITIRDIIIIDTPPHHVVLEKK